MAYRNSKCGINLVDILVEDKVLRVIGNNFVDLEKFYHFDVRWFKYKRI